MRRPLPDTMRKERGAAAIIFALALPILLGIVAFVTDFGYAYYSKQRLQDTLDLAALAGARQLDGTAGATAAATTAIQTVLTDNGFGTLTLTQGCAPATAGDVVHMCLGSFAARNAAGNLIYPTSTRFTSGGTENKAVRLYGHSESPSFFAQIFGVDELDYAVQSTAARSGNDLAQLTIKSTLATLSGGLLNSALGLLGGNTALNVLGPDGIATANVNLLKFLDALAIEANVTAGDYTQLLAAPVTVGKVLSAAATAVARNSTAEVELTALNGAAGLSAAVRNATVKLGDIIDLQTGTPSAGLDTALNVLSLVEGTVLAANQSGALTAGIDISTNALPAALKNILGGTATVSVRLGVIQPPQLSAIGNAKLAKAETDKRGGPNAIYVRTAQFRLFVRIQLPVLNTITTALNGLTSPVVSSLVNTLNSVLQLNLFNILTTLLPIPANKTLLDIKVLPSPEIDLSLELGGGEGYVTDYSCPTGAGTTKQLMVQAASSAVQVRVGKINSNGVFTPTSPAPAVSTIPLVNIGTKQCLVTCLLGLCSTSNCGATNDFAGGGLGIYANSQVVAGTNYPVDTYSNPDEIGVAPVFGKHPHSVTGIVSTLKTTLSGIKVESYGPTTGGLTNVLLGSVSTILSSVVALLNPIISLLSGLVDPIIDALLRTLGIDVVPVDIAANLTCDDARLVN